MQGCRSCDKHKCAEPRQQLLHLKDERAFLTDKVHNTTNALQEMPAEVANLKQQAQASCCVLSNKNYDALAVIVGRILLLQGQDSTEGLTFTCYQQAVL